MLAREIEERTGYETRVTVLGHVQRGGTPTPRDRILATRYGLKAADLVHEGRWGTMAALRGDEIVEVPLRDAVAELKTVPPEFYEAAQDLLRVAARLRHGRGTLSRRDTAPAPRHPRARGRARSVGCCRAACRGRPDGPAPRRSAPRC